MKLPAPVFQKNESAAKWAIGIISVLVLAAIALLPKEPIDYKLPFDAHILATLNALINSTVFVLLVLAIFFVRKKNYAAHKKLMMAAIVLSSLFLVSYILHHLFAGETKFGGAGSIRVFYLIVLASHIILAAVILPLILFTAYRSLTGEYSKHKKIARYTFPVWLYVSVTGVIVYLLISPYYSSL